MLAEEGGIPWVHVMAADASGEGLYADPSRVPHGSDAAVARYPEWLDESPATALFDVYGAYTVDGYQMNDGNSFVMAVELGPAGPRARAILTYSQSEDPASPHFDDQTRLYGIQALRPVRYTEADILADPEREALRLERE